MRTNRKRFLKTLQRALERRGKKAAGLPRSERSRQSITIKKSKFQTITGKSYLKVKILDSKQIHLKNMYIRHLVISGSSVHVENCRIKKINAKEASLKITACKLSGSPALTLKESLVDLAGCRIKSKKNILITDGLSKLIFSLCRITSGKSTRIFHNTAMPPKGGWRP